MASARISLRSNAVPGALSLRPVEDFAMTARRPEPGGRGHALEAQPPARCGSWFGAPTLNA
jgi:hypothetical protein